MAASLGAAKLNDEATEGIIEKQAELPPAQQAVINRFSQRQDAQPRAPRVTAESEPNRPVAIGQPTFADSLGMMLAFGTTEPAVADLLLSHLINAACEGNSAKPPSEDEINRALAAVHGLGAKDQLEAMLAVQMVATHAAAVRALRLLKRSDTIPQQDSNGNLAAKLLRTFTCQVEVLQRYRGKGQQKVTVEHVHVHAGGQAVVGSVSAECRADRGAGDRKATKQPHLADGSGAAHEPGSSMRSQDKVGETLSVAGGPRKKPVPNARRRRGQRRASSKH